MQFQKDKGKHLLALLDSKIEVNVVTLAHATQLCPRLQKSNNGAEKFDNSLLETYNMIMTAFQVLDKLGHSWFFQKTFLLVDISIEVVLGILFLALNNVNIWFTKKKLTWKTYTTEKALPTTRRFVLIN